MKRSFFGQDKSVLTVMVQADNPARIKELIDKSVPEGAEAFGMQFENMKPEYRTKEVYHDLFAYTKDKPVYVTNYRYAKNEGKSDEQLANELVELAECGADLCDVVGDYFEEKVNADGNRFAKQADELAVSESAIKKQMELIDKLHEKGAAVLMSSHVLKYTPAERVLEIAMEHKKKADYLEKLIARIQG